MLQGLINWLARFMGKNSSGTVTRTADTEAYAALDVISTAEGEVITFATVATTPASQLHISRVKMRIDIAAVPAGMDGFRLHLYNASPTAIADNVAYNLPAGDRAKYLGYITLNAPVDLGATLWSETDCDFTAQLATGSTSVYGLLQTLAAYTPSSADLFTIGLTTTGV